MAQDSGTAWHSVRWHDRTRYEGVMQDDCCHGLGVAKFPDSSRYEGEWSRGKMHGFGIYSWKDGSSYQGEWESGAMHGCGTYTPKADKQNQAQAQEGQFLSNEFVGLGLACPVDTARFAAKEAKHFAERAQSFELKSQ